MSVKTVRVCDECNGESPVNDFYFVVKLYRSDPALPQTLDEVHKEVCSFNCIKAVTEKWVMQQR